MAMLFEHGASGSVVDAAGKTALHIFAEDSKLGSWNRSLAIRWRVVEKLLQMLLAHGVDPHVADSSGKRAADYAKYVEVYLFLQGAVGEEPDMDKLQTLPAADPNSRLKCLYKY
ncbi:hypothetical protein FA95DRAFT_1612020 [Auriscalpium vulgare]|uniref:Uncharacterized protein n=1 Tax=Auriscalpium vulgare TaxID=40419 RepID=A0ACB8R880_9AGAM|nr:hypothetical protein FA95DRAFT_1612020 [Auriscalpium vulgare]